MSKLNAREKSIAFVFLAAVGLLTADRFGISPSIEAWQDMNIAIEQKQRELDRYRRLAAESGQIKKAFASLPVSRRDTGSAGSPDNATSLLSAIESVAKETGVKISDLRPEAAQGRAAAGEKVSLSVEAAPDRLMHFIYEIERSPEGFHIEQAAIRQKGEAGTALNGNFVVRYRAGVRST